MRTPSLDEVFMELTGTPVEGASMTTVPPFDCVVRGRAAGFWNDLGRWPTRALRQLRREPASLLLAVFVPAFFYVVNLGALGHVAGRGGLDYKAFLLPMAIAFAVTGVRGPRLWLPTSEWILRPALSYPGPPIGAPAGLMVADVVVIVALTVPVLALGFVLGVRFSTGIEGVAVFVALAALWGLVFTGFPYAVALKTGSPAAVNATSSSSSLLPS